MGRLGRTGPRGAGEGRRMLERGWLWGQKRAREKGCRGQPLPWQVSAGWVELLCPGAKAATGPLFHIIGRTLKSGCACSLKKHLLRVELPALCKVLHKGVGKMLPSGFSLWSHLPCPSRRECLVKYNLCHA